jgi:hypothetical protein
VTDPKPQYVIRLERRRLLWLLFILSFLATVWFAVVLYGESANFGDDPGQWAVLPTFIWGLITAALAACLLVYGIALLTIRERPAQLYRLEDEFATAPDGGPSTPSFLQPPEAEGDADPQTT